VQQWEYIAPEMDGFDLYGGMSQWSDYEYEIVFLEDIGGSGEVFVLNVYFGYNSSHLFIGIINPDQGKAAYGFEIVFITAGDFYHGIEIDSELEEGREITFVNSTYVAYDRELGGMESVDVNKEEVYSDEHYLIADDIRFPQQGLEGYWEFDEGDSIAVIFQAWVHEEKTNTNRPNFSTAVDGFNYLRLSIGHDAGYPLDIHSLFPSSTGQVSDEDLVAKKVSDLNYVLDGKKDEDFWKNTPILPVETVQILELAAGHLLSEVDTRNCNISSAYDDNDLLIHIEAQKKGADSSLEELILILGEDKKCWYNLSSELIVCKITPTDGCYIFNASTVDLMTDAIVPEDVSTGIIYFEVEDWADASGHFDLYEGESSPIMETEFSSSVEFIIPLVENKPTDFPGLFAFSNPDDIVVAHLTLDITPVEPADPYHNFFSEMTLEADQLIHILHELNFSDDTGETTTLEFDFADISYIILIFVGVNTLILRYTRRR
jgi:hypothetical protein